MELFNSEIDMTDFVKILQDNAFANILALFGGLLGFISFIMHLPRTVETLRYRTTPLRPLRLSVSA